MKEIASCNTGSCNGADVDCVLGAWSTYGVCFKEQMSRFRGIEKMASGLAGKGCEGNLEETVSCGDQPVDCKISAWVSWTSCDLECGGGQRFRHRTIWQHPKNGGIACPNENKETEGCNLQECTGAKNCELSTWSAWGACDTDCGLGQKERTRTVTQYRTEGGTGCAGDLVETAVCGVVNPLGTCPAHNCTYGSWSDWSKCSKDCGAGWQKRSRHIETPAGPGGKQCDPAALAEVQACNDKSCSDADCIDGVWNAWGAWEACSATCGGGIHWRTRSVKTTANYCGKALVGNTSEVASCNNDKASACADQNQPCEWNDWGNWTVCSENCNGVTTRSRAIKKMGVGYGAGCDGSTKEMHSCNPGEGEARPDNCPMPASAGPIDCALSDWTPYSQCSHDCGGGVKNRTRTIVTMGANGGNLCNNSLEQVLPCNHQLCANSQASVNCKWGDWTAWGACDNCNGKTTRSRSVIAHGLRGGKPCDPGSAEEVKACEAIHMPSPYQRYCGAAKFCAWAQWGAWGACSATCGNSTKKRRRNLEGRSTDPYTTTIATTTEHRLRLYEQDMKEVMEMRKVRVAKQSQTHAQELVMAFATGGASLFLFMAAMRACRPQASLSSMEGLEVASSEPSSPARSCNSRSLLVDLE